MKIMLFFLTALNGHSNLPFLTLLGRFGDDNFNSLLKLEDKEF